MYRILSLYLFTFLSINLINVIRAEEDVKDYPVFNCTKENRDQHFDNIEIYMNKAIPHMEGVDPKTLDPAHKKMLPKLIEHFKSYRTVKQNLKIACNTCTLEECCQNITALEIEFHDEMARWHQDLKDHSLWEYRFFNCTKENKDKHFDKIESYIDEMIPFLEGLEPEQMDAKQKELLPKVIEHLKSYKTDKQNLKIACNTCPIEECCKNVTALETKFHDELAKFEEA